MSAVGIAVARRYAHLWPPTYWALTMAGMAYCTAVVTGLAPLGGCDGPLVMCDGAAYYYAPSGNPYAWDQLYPGATEFRYAPVFLTVFAPFRLLPWEAFTVVWLGLHFGAFVWLRAGWMLAIPGLNEEAIRGNISVFLAVAIVTAVTRNSGFWAPCLLTKVTLGVGLVWHAVRREWTGLAMALVVSATVIGLSIVTGGLEVWILWIRSLHLGAAGYQTQNLLAPLVVRLFIAVGIIGYAGLTTRSWLLPVGLLLGVPGLWPTSFALLAAIPRLRQLRTVEPRPLDELITHSD